MKTTYVIDYKVLNNLKLKLVPTNKTIDYFFNRNKLIRWEPKTDKFIEINGLIDISFTREMLLDPNEAKQEVNIKNIIYLVNRKVLSEYYFDELNLYGDVCHVIGEDVKNKIKLFDEYHIVFNDKIVDSTPSFAFKTVFYGNIYDYLELKKTEI